MKKGAYPLVSDRISYPLLTKQEKIPSSVFAEGIFRLRGIRAAGLPDENPQDEEARM